MSHGMRVVKEVIIIQHKQIGGKTVCTTVELVLLNCSWCPAILENHHGACQGPVRKLNCAVTGIEFKGTNVRLWEPSKREHDTRDALK